jgi:hypothetical protein
LNINATTNTIFKRLKTLEEIFDTSHKVEKKLITLATMGRTLFDTLET